MHSYKSNGYTLTINDDEKPLISLYVGGQLVDCKETRKDELEIDAVQRVVNWYIKHRNYQEWLYMARVVTKATDGEKVDGKDEEVWLEYLKSLSVIHLRDLIRQAKEDYGS